VIQTVPRRGYRFVADVSRVGEEEVEEFIVERRTVSQTTITATDDAPARLVASPSNRKPWIVALAVLVVVTLAFAFFRPTRSNAVGGTKRTIAILPLRPLATGSHDSPEDLGAGITENLASRLGGLKQLTVLSTRAASRLAELETDPLVIGTKLGADAVLDGSYQTEGGRILLVTRLLNVTDGAQIWAGSFDEPENDLFRLQDNLASQAARSLIDRLTEEQEQLLAKRSTEDVEAYKLYLRGRHEWSKRTADGFEKSIAAYRQAIDRDPSFSLAHAGLADTYAVLADYYIEPAAEAFPKAKASALRALDIDPDSAHARTTLAYILATFDWNYAEAEREYKAAIEAEPNYATAHQWYGEMLCALHRYDESEVELSKAVELDPLVPVTLSERAVLLYYKGELDASLAAFADLKRDHPTFATSFIFSAWIYGLKGDDRRAFDDEMIYLRLQGLDEPALQEMRAAFEKGGRQAFLTKVTERNVRAADEGAFPQYKFAHAFARLRDREQTLYWIERCLDTHAPNIIKIASDRNFDFLRDDPRFQAAVARLNLPVS
jgi:TolB-like protein